jgi:hypothetical protein
LSETFWITVAPSDTASRDVEDHRFTAATKAKRGAGLQACVKGAHRDWAFH